MEESACQACRNWLLAALLLSLGTGTTVVLASEDLRCGPGITTPGVTVPSGDIILEHGKSPLEIYCILNPTVVKQGFNSSNLVFYHNTERFLSEFVTLVNESTARLYIEKPAPMKRMFYCKLTNGSDETSVCLNSVAVGYAPHKVLNFSCVSHNWDNLNCTWMPPLNYVKTEYSLYYLLPGRAGGRLKYPCPNDTDIKGKNYCYWDQATKTPYRQPYEYYFFVITGKNKFGNITSDRIKFHHYAHVIPKRAENLTSLEKTSSSALLEWSVVFPMQNFPPGVVQKVEYQSQWDPRDYWQVVNTSSLNIKSATHRLNVTGLKYPNSHYDFRVFMRSPFANEDKWSLPATKTITTKPTVPNTAPLTDVGSFEAMQGQTSRDVYVYWRQIPEYMYNGDSFRYVVIASENDDDQWSIQPNETTRAYAKFLGLSRKKYRFRIYSENSVGLSPNYSEVVLPSHATCISEPLSFTKIAFDQHIYELSWKPPITSRQITSYTIFWCDNQKDRPYQCLGTLNWMKVSKDVVIKNITVPDDKIYQFAISANSHGDSSGMVWASCTVIHNRILGKMKSVWINHSGSTFIEVGWKLECSDRIGVVTGFKISYCPAKLVKNSKDEPPTHQCKVDPKNITIKGDGMTIRGNVTNLTPYTTYTIMVAVVTKNGIGQWSDEHHNATLEAAPDMPPQNVHVVNVTNTSMVVLWTPPTSMNGVLRYYDVHYNGQKDRVDGTPTGLQSHGLVRLQSYVTYNVSVTACTVACSTPSDPVQVRTAIGRPGKLERPLVTFVNSSQLEVKWKPPLYPAGLLDGYEVRVEIIDEKSNLTQILNGTGTQSQINIEDCNNGEPQHVYSFQVRAVNYDNDTAFFGPWSEPGVGNCYSTGTEDDLWTIIWVIVFLMTLLFMLAFAFFGRRAWDWFKEVRAVTVIIPPGLDDSLNKTPIHQESEFNMHGWKIPPASKEKEANLPDQELLLQKKNGRVDFGMGGEMETGDGESSGCSSGHESVASSITGGSGTQVSSDSGTEADQLHDQGCSSLDPVFSDSTPSLRLRNKASSTSSESSSNNSSGRWERHGNEPYVMLGASLANSSAIFNDMDNGGGYSVASAGAAAPAWRPAAVASGYVSLPPMVPPPHWPAKEAGSPVKGYVMAGEGEPTGATGAQYSRLGDFDYVPHG